MRGNTHLALWGAIKSSFCACFANACFQYPHTTMLQSLYFRVVSIALLFSSAPPLHSAAADRTAIGPRTALDRYVHAPDTNYSFRLAKTIKEDGCTTYQIDMIS